LKRERTEESSGFVVEPEKKVPVVYDVDVAVAGASISGVFAALAAARCGADTVLIDRFGQVGGNMGPGMIVQGGKVGPSPRPPAGLTVGMHKGSTGIAQEFTERYASLRRGGPVPSDQTHYPRDSSTASYTALKMLQESGVKLMLSAFAADPVMEGNRVVGLFVENKSGREAIRAKVVVDATGDADVAKRAGAPILYPKQEYHQLDGHAPTGMGIGFVVGNVDWEAFKRAQQEPSEEDVRWAEQNLGEKRMKYLHYVLGAARKASEAGDFPNLKVEGLSEAWIKMRSLESPDITAAGGTSGTEDRIAWGVIGYVRKEVMNTGDGVQISLLEARSRQIIFETVDFYRNYVPGFERAYLLCIAPFLGARGGPCIEGEYTLTMQDGREGKQFDDVVYAYPERRVLQYTSEHGEPKWMEVPYRVMLPKKIDGLVAVGRSASGKPDTLLRSRTAVKYMGEAGGTAAAMAAKQGISPKQVDVKELQRRLLNSGLYLGNVERLKELKLLE